MPDIDLIQEEADGLIAMAKFRFNNDVSDYPGMGGVLTVPLISQDRREHFLLDISRGRIDLLKGKYQSRGRQVVVLVRVPGRAHSLGGGSPLQTRQGELLAERQGCPPRGGI